MFNIEERELQELCRQFASKELGPKARLYEDKEDLNMEAFKKMGEIGLLGITADPKYGGAGMGCLAASIAMEEFSYYCPGTTLSYLAHSILCINNIQNNGSEEQKEKYLPKLITGEWIGSMCMSEPDFGSDAIGMQTSAKKKGKKYIINGAKTWITNAKYSDITYVYTRTGPEKKNLSTFILEKEKGHFKYGTEIHKMGMRSSPTGEIIFENSKVPADQLVGKVGDSMLHMLKNLEIERITLAAMSLGIARVCLDKSIKYSKERYQFGKPIGEFQLIQKMIAEMSSEYDMMSTWLYKVARDYDEGRCSHVDAAKVKLIIPKLTTKIALDAIQIGGGMGYSREYDVGRVMADNKLLEIGGGTNEIMINIIAKNLLK